MRCEGLRRWFRGSSSIKELEQLTTDLLKLLHLLLLRQVGAFRQPFTDRGEAPAFAVVGHAPHQHPQQAQLVITTVRADAQLHQQTAAFQAWTPTREVKREVERFRLSPLSGLRVVPPGAEVDLCSRKLATHKRDRGCKRSHPGHAMYRFARVHCNLVTPHSVGGDQKGRRYGCARFTKP